MELKIIPSDKNMFPLRGMLIRGESFVYWMKELQFLGVARSEVQIYGIPNLQPNTIWGCFVLFNTTIDKHKAGRHELVQAVSTNLFISERTTLSPALPLHEVDKLFNSNKHIIHPEFGFVELESEIDFKELLIDPILKSAPITKPVRSAFVPKTIRSFQVHSVPPEEIMKNMAEKMFPEQKKMEGPLSVGEKLKLGLYRMLFRRTKDPEGKGHGTSATTPTGLAGYLEKLLNKIRPGKSMEKMQAEFENLEERNKKQVDRLIDLFKNNPDEALKYAVPLDNEGVSRGGIRSAPFDLSMRWFNFSLFGNSGAPAAGYTIDLGDHFHTLNAQYRATATELANKGEYQKAAFIYMKLLKDYFSAAEVLAKGKFYKEAATVYYKHASAKSKAAECYEKANMIDDAIAVHKELNNHEKVGDLYMQVSNRKEAFIHYEKVIDDYKRNTQYIKAAVIYREKMNAPQLAQRMLKDGWKDGKDAVNCLSMYFASIPDKDLLRKEIETVYKDEVDFRNREKFLSVLKNEFARGNELRERVRDIAYEVVAAHVKTEPSIVSELKAFVPGNKEFVKDALRFKFMKNTPRNP
jgi:tetratricopeptide (TPR) repeat protein